MPPSSSSGGRLAAGTGTGRIASARSTSAAPPVPSVERSQGAVTPDRFYVEVPGMTARQTQGLANQAARRARATAPKLSGRGARGIKPYWGNGFFGVSFADPYMGYQENGTRAFTMRNLAGKTIPMWLDDPTGKLHRDNPKAETRITANGRRQVKLFRKAAKIGARKTVTRRGQQVTVPQSYPGAPGRIAYREVTEYDSATGKIAKMHPRAHSGVRWRHPGLMGRHFMHLALSGVAADAGLGRPEIQATFRRR